MERIGNRSSTYLRRSVIKGASKNSGWGTRNISRRYTLVRERADGRAGGVKAGGIRRAHVGHASALRDVRDQSSRNGPIERVNPCRWEVTIIGRP